MTGRDRLGCILTALPTLLFITGVILFAALRSPVGFVLMAGGGVTIVGQALRYRIKNPLPPRQVPKGNYYCGNCRRRVDFNATFCPHCRVRLMGVVQGRARKLGWPR
jgi:hypothetical protein